jgi:diamine N-acetyltransferase
MAGPKPGPAFISPRLSVHRIALDHLAEIAGLEVDEGQLPFFAPTAEIVEEAIRHRDRIPMAIRAGDALVGFFVFRRDPRDPRCWWLAWFMMDRRQQGKGYGKAALRLILAHLARREGCRRIRLQVTPGNDMARRLYLLNGFAGTGLSVEGDDVLELAVPAPFAGEPDRLAVAAARLAACAVAVGPAAAPGLPPGASSAPFRGVAAPPGLPPAPP